MVNRFNTDLANNLGDLSHGWPPWWARRSGGVARPLRPDSPLAAVAVESYADHGRMGQHRSSLALEARWKSIGAANAHLEANEPWKMEPGPELDTVMGDALEVLRLVAVLATPRAIPWSSEEVWTRIGLPGVPGDQRLRGGGVGRLPGGLPVVKGDPLFPA